MNLELAQFIATLLAPLTTGFALWLVLRQQNTNKPLTAAQTDAATMAGLSDQFGIMKETTRDQAQTIANMRADTAERELAARTQIAKLQDQLVAQGITAKEQSEKQEGLLRAALEELASVKEELRAARGEIAELNAKLTTANAATAEAKQETAKAEAKQESAEAKPDTAPAMPFTLESPLPITVVDTPKPPEPTSP